MPKFRNSKPASHARPHLHTPKKTLFKAPIGRLQNDFNAKTEKNDFSAKTEKAARRQRNGYAPFVGVDFSCAGGRNYFVRSDTLPHGGGGYRGGAFLFVADLIYCWRPGGKL